MYAGFNRLESAIQPKKNIGVSHTFMIPSHILTGTFNARSKLLY